MKKYFEYPVNDKIKKKILDFYEDVGVDMHTSQTQRKSKIKMERILNEVSFNKQDIVLDIGCSRGEFLKMIHSQIKRGIGIDISANIICLNKKENQYKNVSYGLFDGLHVQTEVKADKVCMLDVLEHAFEPDALIESVYCSMNGGGVFNFRGSNNRMDVGVSVWKIPYGAFALL